MAKEFMPSGVVIIDKAEGVSSQRVVNAVKRIFGVGKAGHTGTLDPLATGVLPVLIGRGVKASEFMLCEDKRYEATLLLGITTDTEDVTGEVLTRSDIIPTEDEVRAAAGEFTGRIMQTPPMYSAIKIGGKKLYELARAGKTVEREPREVIVKRLDVKRLSEREYLLSVECSKGTYIRTLCADIGAKLGTGGVMKTLRRTEAAGFTLADAVTLEALEAMSDTDRLGAVIPVERIFSGAPRVSLSAFYSRLARCGLEIYLKKIGADFPLGEKVLLFDGGVFFALGEVREYEDGLAIKPIRQFDV